MTQLQKLGYVRLGWVVLGFAKATLRDFRDIIIDH